MTEVQPIEKQTININSKAFSVNSMYGKRRTYTTSAYQDWAHGIFYQLNTEENLEAMKILRETFDPSSHYYSIKITTYYPYALLITQKGILSSKAFDVSNTEKPLIDLIFLPKYYGLSLPYGALNLKIDDRYIGDLHSIKRVSPDDEFKIKVELEIIPLEQSFLKLTTEPEEEVICEPDS